MRDDTISGVGIDVDDLVAASVIIDVLDVLDSMF